MAERLCRQASACLSSVFSAAERRWVVRKKRASDDSKHGKSVAATDQLPGEISPVAYATAEVRIGIALNRSSAPQVPLEM